MNNLDKQYIDLLQDILDNGVTKSDRTGTGTKSLFGRQIRHKMSDGFPLLTSKKMPFKTIVTELLWFLRGDTNIKYLVDNNCHIWDGDAYKNYCNQIPEYSKQFTMSKEEYVDKIKTDDEFAKRWGDLGPIYGKQWRSWYTRELMFRSDVVGEPQSLPEFFEVKVPIDQIANLINDLKTNPDSRRLIVNAWNVGELDQMVLPPCHYGFQVYTRELSLEERFEITDKVNKEIRQDLYSYAFNNPIYTGGINQRPDDVERHECLNDLDIPTRAISLMWNQRSVDTFLGLPFNIASYGLLLMMIADEVNMVPEEVIGNLGDVHLYSNHIEQAKEQIGRELSLEERRKMVTQEMFNQIYNGGGPESLSHSEIDQWNIPRIELRKSFPLPTLKIGDEVVWAQYECLPSYSIKDFTLENYQSHPTIKAPLSN